MDVITAADRLRGKMKLTVNGSETITIPLGLYKERPMEPGTYKETPTHLPHF